MKLITFTVPCYNSAEYMQKCVDSLLVGGDEVEIIIINDGSKDDTGAIADRYVERFPQIVRAIHQENGGHGEGINQGMKHATGEYFRVVDSDDWLDSSALLALLSYLRGVAGTENAPDAVITNFIYDKQCNGTRYVSSYEKYFPRGDCDWEKAKRFPLWHMLLMHAITYKTALLREKEFSLPKHTFYEDNLFAYAPLGRTRKLYYLDVNLYHYLIGREGQSVTVQNIIKRYAQQIRVMCEVFDAYSYEEIQALPRGLRRYLKHSLGVLIANTIYFTCGADDEERRVALKAMWQGFKARDKKLYRFLRYRTWACILMPLPWKPRGRLAGWAYNMLCKIIKLG